MKKRLLTVAGATVLALSMSVSAFAADMVTSDVDYGTAGNAVEGSEWNSAANGQFEIKDNTTITFTFNSTTNDTSNAVFGWVAEVSEDSKNWFTITQGGTGWLVGDWLTNGQYTIEKSWEDTDAAAYAAATVGADVVLKVTRSGKQFVFESTTKGSDGKEYTQKAVGVLSEEPTGSVFVQVGCDHGSMIMYSAKYSEAGAVEEVTTKENVTLKPNMDANKGVAGSNDSTSESNDSDSSTTVIVVVVAVVLVVAVVAGVLVATKKKNN